jgi:putative oxidoreductase
MGQTLLAADAVTISESAFAAAMLLLRVALGPMMFAHGYQKQFMGGRIEGTAGWFESMGMKPGRLNAWMASLTEMGTGIMLTLGLLTPLAAAGVVGVMVVAWFTHRGAFFVFKDGWEYNWVIGAAAVAVATLGPGAWSLDDLLGIADDLNGWVGFAVSAGLGLVAGFGTIAVFHRPEPTSEAA